MKTLVFVSALLCLVVTQAHGRGPARGPNEDLVPMVERRSPVSLDHGPRRSLRSAAANDTTVLGSWSFDGTGSCSAQGWVAVDTWAQPLNAFHVDDFGGLGGGNTGRLMPLEGAQSLWCGARPDPASAVFCQYSTLPGYGNSWDQTFTTAACLSVAGDVSIDYLISYDSEPSYDFTRLQYDLCDNNWNNIAEYGPLGPASASESRIVPGAAHLGQIRLRFAFSSDGAFSDADGLWSTDGACIVDSLTVTDAAGIVLPTELFEVETVGDNATASGNWVGEPAPGYGSYSGLALGGSLVQEDPCVSNFSCMWAFITGSTANYACGGYPQQPAVPFIDTAAGRSLQEYVESPRIPYVGTGQQVELHFDVYRDLPMDNLVFYNWAIRSWMGDCPGSYKRRTSVYYGGQKDWFRAVQVVGDLVVPGAEELQVHLMVRDMCLFWCGTVGTGACHSHAPLFDNVEVIRIKSNGPRWTWVRDIDLFQDTFSSDGTLTGTGRTDTAIDKLPSSNPGILPGDSAVVTVFDEEVGLAVDAHTGFGNAVYLYASVWPQGQPGKSGSALTQDSFRYPVVDSLTHNGNQWYCVRTDTSFNNGINRTGAQPDRYCVDLNDNLFAPGDTICFVFCAENALGQRTYFTTFTETTDDLNEALANPDEFQVLPGGGVAAGGDILYVDAYDGYGAQPFFDTAFQMLGIDHQVDRFDIRGPSSSQGNRPGYHAVVGQLLGAYRKIIWNSGDLSDGLIGDGTGSPEKADDAALLAAFLDNIPGDPAGGVYFSGDDIADELYNKTAPSGSLIGLRAWITGSAAPDHNALGLGVAPLAIAAPLSCFDHVTGPDTLIAYGGCAGINDFDVLTPGGTATLEMSYGGAGAGSGAVIAQRTLNSASGMAGVVLSGFSYHEIRDDRVTGVMDRGEHLYDILTWLGNTVQTPVAAGPVGLRNSLSQNYPNPFNPVTSIEFSLKTRAHVTVKVYNVAGQLVATLLNEVRAAGVYTDLRWDGRNSAGQSVASGVYFYRLSTKEFVQTRKMVLLK